MPVIKFNLKKNSKSYYQKPFLQSALGSDSTVMCEKTIFKGLKAKELWNVLTSQLSETDGICCL